MIIALASDHGGFELKEAIKSHFLQEKFNFVDLGPADVQSVDYPDYAAAVAGRVSRGEADVGILVCGTGLGMCIAANKFKNVRAVVLNDPYVAEMAKAHNNANVICLGGRTTDPELAWQLIQIWLRTPFAGERHERRLEKIKELER